MSQTLASGTGREYLVSLASTTKNLLARLTYTELLFGVVPLFLIFLFLGGRPAINAPYAGYRSKFEPRFLVRARFFANARSIISSGYDKYKSSVFLVRRSDIDIVVLSRKYLDELRLIPNSRLSSTYAQMKNLLGEHTYGTIMLESNLHVRVLQNQLTPKLDVFLGRANQELQFGLQQDFPVAKEWVEIDIQDVIRKLVSRMSSAAFVGPLLCRDSDWLRLCVDFSINVFEASMTLRVFPAFTHSFIAFFLPAKRRINQNMELAAKLLTPLIASHQFRIKDGEIPPLVDWMIDNGTDKENEAKNVAARQLILTLASIHTTATAVSHALFDLCAHPELLGPLQMELEAVLSGTKLEDMGQEHLSRLHLLDSFIVESQRLNPPILLSPQRVVMEPLNLHDGTRLPKGVQIGFPVADILADDELTPNAKTFDAYRSYRMDPESRYTLGKADKDHLSFGHGKQVCPGRMFAAAEIKMVFARFLLGFEAKFVKAGSRPSNMFVHELIFCDPKAKLMIRRK